MSLLKKRGAKWYVYGRDSRGKEYRVSTRQTSRQAAEVVKRRIELERALPPEVAPLPLRTVLDLARAQMELRQNAEATMVASQYRNAQLERLFGPRTDVTRFRVTDFEWYMAERRKDGVSDHTIEKELRHLSFGLRLARRDGLYQADPKHLWPEALRDVYTPRNRWLPFHEYQALLEQAAPHRRDYIVIYCHTGIRYSELYQIRPEHIDLAGRRVFIAGTKTRKSRRWVPLSQDALEVFSRRQSFPAWGRSRMNADLKRWCERAGIARCSPNDFRRTFASWMANLGVPEAVTAEILGHANSKMLRSVYQQLAPSTLQQAVERLPNLTRPGNVVQLRREG